MRADTNRWLEAAQVLGRDPEGKVDCPRCQKAILRVEDVHFGGDPTRFERILRCDACGAWNALRMRAPSEPRST